MIETTASYSVFTGMFKFIASFLALFTAEPGPLAAEYLPVQLVAQGEMLDFAAPVRFTISEDGNGGMAVSGMLPAREAARLADFTGRHIGEAVGFEVCGVSLMTPVVRERVAGRKILISGAEATETMLGFLERGCP